MPILQYVWNSTLGNSTRMMRPFNANGSKRCQRYRRLAMRYLWREAQMLGGGYPSAWKH